MLNLKYVTGEGAHIRRSIDSLAFAIGYNSRLHVDWEIEAREVSMGYGPHGGLLQIP